MFMLETEEGYVERFESLITDGGLEDRVDTWPGGGVIVGKC